MAHQAPAKRYRVVQWATGNVGARALRRVIEHPALELVGVHVTSAAKVGRDAGDLAGVALTGVSATGNIADVLALRPDCVLYMPQQTSIDDVCHLLEAGVNIVTTRGDFHYPPRMDPAVRERVEAACQHGDTSIHSTGSSPGFVTEALPMVLASLQRSLTHLAINEFADCSSRNSPEMIFDVMGFGQPPAGSNEMRYNYLLHAFSPSLAALADALALPLDDFTVSGGIGLARYDTQISAGLVRAGTVAAQRTRISGVRHGKVLIEFTATWYVSTEVDTDDGEPWHFRQSGWHLVMQGDVPLDVSITYPVAPEDYAEMTPGLTAHRPVNMVPYVCEAAPGIRTTFDLPHVIATLG